MKTIPLVFVFLVLIGCGKKNEGKKSFQVSNQQISFDTDGDGVMDMPMGLQVSSIGLELRSKSGMSQKIHGVSRRVFRDKIMEAFQAGIDTVDLPLVNSASWDLTTRAEYWKMALSAQPPTYFRWVGTGSTTAWFSFSEISPQIKLQESSKVRSAFNGHYRFIISNEKEDLVFFLPTQLRLEDFLHARNFTDTGHWLNRSLPLQAGSTIVMVDPGLRRKNYQQTLVFKNGANTPSPYSNKKLILGSVLFKSNQREHLLKGSFNVLWFINIGRHAAARVEFQAQPGESDPTFYLSDAIEKEHPELKLVCY